MTYATAYQSASFVSDLAHALLATAASALGAAAPASQYVSAGQPAADGCDQLVVWVDALRLVRPKGVKLTTVTDAETMEPKGALPVVDFNVQILRCGAPVIQGNVLPTPTAIDTHAVSMLTDGWPLYRGILAALYAQTLFGTPNPVPGHHTLVKDMTAYGPAGGVAGWTVPVCLSLY